MLRAWICGEQKAVRAEEGQGIDDGPGAAVPLPERQIGRKRAFGIAHQDMPAAIAEHRVHRDLVVGGVIAEQLGLTGTERSQPIKSRSIEPIDDLGSVGQTLRFPAGGTNRDIRMTERSLPSRKYWFFRRPSSTKPARR